MLLSNNVFAYKQITDDAGFAGSYLFNFSANARASALGMAYTAIADDSGASYWNPAGISQLSYKEGSFLYSKLFEGTAFSYIGYAHPITDSHVIGISRVGFDMEDIEKTDSSGGKIGDMKDSQATYMLSYAYKFNNDISAGVNFKLVSQSFDIYSDTGYGIDLGGMYKINKLFSTGIMLQNILPAKLKLKDETDTLPSNLRVGVAHKFFDEQLLGTVDVSMLNLFPKKDLYNDSVKLPLRWYVGAEYKMFDVFSARAGINYKEITCGIGADAHNILFDYAIGIQDLGLTHRFSLAVRFGLLLTQEEKALEENRIKIEIGGYYQEALKAYNEKDYETALLKANEVLRIVPEDSKAKKLLDEINFMNRKKEAYGHFESGLQYLLEGKEREGIDEIQVAEKLYSDIRKELEIEHLTKAKEHISLKEYDKAQVELLKVLTINPENEEAGGLAKKVSDLIEINK